MKVGILAGGFGTRLMEETRIRPKPMVKIGDMPILWHIMKYYSFFGFNEFVVALGYKGEFIKDFFLNYFNHTHSLSIDLNTNNVRVHNGNEENWVVHLLDTGLNTLTGGRIKQISKFIGDETFMLTYGDGVANININKLIATHKRNKKYATVTAVHPSSRYGELRFEKEIVKKFQEKPQIGEGWINGGFFVLEPKIRDYIDGNNIAWEREPLSKLVEENQLAVYKHDGYWQSMDSLRDVQTLNNLWETDNAQWKIW